MRFAVVVLLVVCGPSVAAAPVPPAAQTFPLRDVRILDGPFLDVQQRDLAYLMSLDPDRLLHTFRLNAGLPTTAKPYGGWEAPSVELRGHSLGHYLTACALLYEATGDERLKARALGLVAELRKVQQALPSRGMHPGYLSAFPEEFVDRVEARKGVWAPYYTLHKIMAGLLDAYTYCGSKQALDVLKKMSAWVKFRTDRLSEEQMQSSLNTEFGGVGESLANLYAITGDPKDLALARRLDKKWFTDPLSKGVDNLRGLHSNTHIPQVVSSAAVYELTGEKRFHDIATFFWTQVAKHRTFAVGGTSNFEAWRTDPDKDRKSVV